MIETYFAAELEKIGMTRGQKTVFNLIRKGKPEAAEEVAKRLGRTGGIKISPEGTHVRSLGGGSEGFATRVFGAEDRHGISARKLYNQQGLFSEDQLRRKVEAGKELRGNPNFAELYSDKARIAKGPAQLPYTHSEFVDGKTVPEYGQDLIRQAKAGTWRDRLGAVGKMIKGSVRLSTMPHALKGRVIHDLGTPGNVRVTKDGKFKAVDYLIAKKEEYPKFLRKVKAAQGPLGADIGKMREAWQEMGLNAGPATFSPPPAKAFLEQLGPGSRQAKKVVGAKEAPPATREALAARLRSRYRPASETA